MRLARWILLMAIGVSATAAAQPSPLGTTSGTGFTGAPYSATETTVVTIKGADGVATTETHVTQIWRDAEGRTRQEHLVRGESGFQNHEIVITDPHAGVTLKWIELGDPPDYMATISPLPQRQRATGPPPGMWNHDLSGRPGTAVSCGPLCRRDILAPQQVNGELANGWRVTRIVQGMKATNELWFSADLAIILRHITDDPLGGRNETNVTDVVRGDPDPELFKVPKGYKVRRME